MNIVFAGTYHGFRVWRALCRAFPLTEKPEKKEGSLLAY